MVAQRTKKIPMPPGTGMDGPVNRGKVSVVPGGKPPKLRFRPGQYIEYQGRLHELMFAYRLRDDPHEWIYALEEREDLSDQKDVIGQIARHIGCGESTPRIVYDIFLNSVDANTFFFDIPADGDRIHVRNRSMMKKAKIISSGAVLSRGNHGG